MDKETYSNFDELDFLPVLNRENYIFETDFLVRKIPEKSSLLQIGSMEGQRAVRLMQVRPDIKMTGMEIEAQLVEKARDKVRAEGVSADFIQADITEPPQPLPGFDYVICLNNTLGFIPEYNKAIQEMRRIGDNVYISVFGELFSDDLAREYFDRVGISLDRIDGDYLFTSIGRLRRFREEDVLNFRPKEIISTPLGYLASI